MRKMIGAFIILALVIIIIIGIIRYFYIPKRVLIFQESNKEVLNPGRGFYVQIYSNEEERIERLKEEKVKIVLIAYDIEDYLNQKIPDEKLMELQTVLDKAREHSMQVVFRSAYGFDSDYNDPDNIDIIYNHIKQIAPILNAYKDVILSVQAGFIGPWGEWHSSKFLTGDADEVRMRNQTLSVLLDNLNRDIVVNVRRPRFIRDAINAGINQSRLGLHNDALLSTKDDMGTYDDPNYSREEELAWAKANITYGVNGGEMPAVSKYSIIDNATLELKSLQLTYLNSRYNKEVLDEWKTTEYMGQNGLDYINNHLGYRLWLREVELPKYLKPNRKFNAKIVIENSGLAPIKKGSKFFIVMKSGKDIIFECKLDGQLSSIKGGITKDFIANVYIDDLFQVASKEDILVGVYITNPYSVSHDTLSSDINSRIKLANSDMINEDGIYYFTRYRFDNNKYVLQRVSNVLQ